MKNKKLNYTDITVKCRNAREESLVDIYNDEMERYIDDMVSYATDGGSSIGEQLLSVTGFIHWTVEELHGESRAMYFLGMIDKPFSDEHKALLEGYIKRTGNTPHAYKVLYGEEK